MTLELLMIAAVAAASPATDQASSGSYAGVRAEGRVAVRIVEGARIAAGEIQQSNIPAVQDSVVRSADGNTSPARLVEFQ